jgi:hypothetical protein
MTLLEGGLRRLRALEEAIGVTALVACCQEDGAIWEAVAAHGLETARITKQAAAANTWADAFGALREPLAHRFDWLIDGNFLCRPFLSVDTIQRIVELARTATRPLVTATLARRLVWNLDGDLIAGSGQTANGVSNPESYVANHLAYVIPAMMLGNEEEAARAVPVDVKLSPLDRIDIDDQDDLDLARLIGRDYLCSSK